MGFVHRFARAGALLAVLAANAFLPAALGRSGEPNGVTPLVDQVATQIQLLGSESFAERTKSQRSLVRIAAADQQSYAIVIQSLQQSVADRDIEVSIASRELISEIRDLQWHRLTEDALRAKDIDELRFLPGWVQFSELFGADVESRNLYRRICRRHARVLQSCFAVDPETKASVSKSFRLQAIDFGRLDRESDAIWALVMFLDCTGGHREGGRMSWQLGSLLRQPGHGPVESLSSDPAFRRVIETWLRLHESTGLSIDRIKIAMRYRCGDTAAEISRRILDSPTSPASDQAIALLTLTRLSSLTSTHYRAGGWSESERMSLQTTLRGLLDDRRVCHCYRTRENPNKPAQVQLGDVALALLMNQSGLDPRTVGFQELQADPMFIYRDTSLGFASEAQRQQAKETARGLLQQD
ncbi:hypothetical protein [Stieleria varia]|uniref:Uncharacterized protein n=1 Tax=Stieleria varia TaxID=2528005 RepID=A0A5C6B0K8_9BACT|nr:hypothetical protein [Stieleria varia]TWU05835.1 hypothetical protein Pla52n_15500 [Stieleria varia]